MKKIKVLMLLSVLLVCLSSVASAQTWDWVHSDDEIGCYYARGSAVQLSYRPQAGETNRIHAWFKYQYEDEDARQNMARELESKGDDSSNFYYAVAKFEFKYLSGRLYMRSVYATFYNYDGSRIAAHNLDGNWEVAGYNSVGMKMYNRAAVDAR